MNNSSQVLRELQSLRLDWRTQNFTFTKEQQARYTELQDLRRAFVAYWKENGMVWVGPLCLTLALVIGETHVEFATTLRLNLTGLSVALSRNLLKQGILLTK